jgi:hypothetical protein
MEAQVQYAVAKALLVFVTGVLYGIKERYPLTNLMYYQLALDHGECCPLLLIFSTTKPRQKDPG